MTFQKLEVIGSGGFGTVYRAITTRGDQVALKEFSPTFVAESTADDRSRFEREIRILSKLDHENILPLLAYNLEAAPPWFVTPLAVCSIADVVGELPQDLERIHRIFRQILEGVRVIHDSEMIHRDLKPQNILLFDDDLVKIGDFGLGKRIDPATFTLTLTTTGQRIGSFCYMAPEQKSNSKSVDYRCDIYALGVILFVLLTGDDPCALDAEEVNDEYRYIVEKCVAPKPERRYQSIEELIRDFDFTLEHKYLEIESEKFQQGLETALAQPPSSESIKQVSVHLLNWSANREILLKYFPQISSETVDTFLELEPETFFRILERYNGFLDVERLAFSYCDTIADTYEFLYAKVDRSSIRKLILNRLLGLGYSYGRWHVQGVFFQLLQQIRVLDEALIAVEVLRDNTEAVKGLSADFSKQKLIKVIHDAVKEIIGET